MQDHHFETTLEQADEMLRFAEEQFCRPQEDIILDQVASHIHKATAHYLAAYLIRHAREVRPTMPIPYLLRQCGELDPKFQSIALEPTLLEQNAALNLANINNALKAAQKIKEMSQVNLN